MATLCRLGTLSLLALVVLFASVFESLAQQFGNTAKPGIITMKNGLRLGPGIRGELATISKDSMARGQAETATNSILSIDDDLRVTYVNRSRVDAANSLETVNTVAEEIDLPSKNEVARGDGMLAILGVAGVTEFNRHGRRIYSIEGPRGRQDILQGITKLTPLYAQVQTLRTSGAITWDQRVATSTIPPDKLREILFHQLDLKQSGDWIRVYRFYLQAERLTEARRVLVEALERFPEQEGLRDQLITLDQALAEQMFREIELRSRNGQPQLAARLLQECPTDIIENQLRVQEQLEKLKGTVTQLTEIVQALQQQVAELPPADATIVRPLIDQIANEISIESATRLSDYARFRSDASMPVDRRIAFAIGGWLLGSGSGLDNFEVAKSIIRVRELVREYLADASTTRRQEILDMLNKEEGGRPETVGKIIAAMKPPLPFPLPTAQPGDSPVGLVRMSVPGALGADGQGQAFEYTVQLPPEYSPYRRYPCIVALAGLGTVKDMEINWWCGAYNEKFQSRVGQAARNGYIVISPKWMDDNQFQYNYSELEHDRVLRCLRDAMRRLSIDTDRVFISGHFDGGAAAWDIALSHPDLWAGAILLSPAADKYILAYGSNAVYVPTYSVWGKFDGSLNDKLGKTIDDYLRSPKFDAIGVEYIGRPRDHFLEEVPRIMDWMELTSHRRERSPRELNLETSRAGDRFFYWLEIPVIDSNNIVSPVHFENKTGKVEASLPPGGNVIRISKYPGKQVQIWLRPDMVNFAQPVDVIHRGKSRKFNVTAENKILLEDVRTRGDRQAPFYASITVP